MGKGADGRLLVTKLLRFSGSRTHRTVFDFARSLLHASFDKLRTRSGEWTSSWSVRCRFGPTKDGRGQAIDFIQSAYIRMSNPVLFAVSLRFKKLCAAALARFHAPPFFSAVESKGRRGTPRRRAVHVSLLFGSSWIGMRGIPRPAIFGRCNRSSRASCETHCGAACATKEAPARRPREWSPAIVRPLRTTRIVRPRASKRRSRPRGRTVRTAPFWVGWESLRKLYLVFKRRVKISAVRLSSTAARNGQ